MRLIPALGTAGVVSSPGSRLRAAGAAVGTARQAAGIADPAGLAFHPDYRELGR